MKGKRMGSVNGFSSVLVVFCFLAFVCGDRDGLEALYLNTNGQDWFANGDWLSDFPVCSWEKVGCASEEIAALLLSSNNLVGSIPSELFANLTRIQQLELQKNQLTGSLPSEIQELANLQIIKLQENGIEQKIPSEIGLLSKLIQLSLAENSLSGFLPSEIGELSNLELLFLFKNFLDGPIPTEIGRLLKLRDLNLNNNRFEGQMPSEIGLLSNLESLSLETSSLRGTLPSEIAQLSNLKILDVGRSGIAGTLPTEYAELTQLTIFYLIFTQLNGTIPTEYGTMNVQQLALMHANLEGEIPTELANLPLEVLQLRDLELTGSIPSELAKLSNLRLLDLNDNNLSGEIPTLLGTLSSLRQLFLGAGDYTTIPTEFGNLNLLDTIDMSYCQLTGSLPTEFGNLERMRAMILPDNSLSGTLPTEFGKLISLRTLLLSHNRIQGTIPTEFENLVSLEEIYLSGLPLLEGTLPDFSSLPNIERVQIRDASLSGFLPESFCNIETFDFTGSQFYCPLPSCCDNFGPHKCGEPCLPPPIPPSPTPSPPFIPPDCSISVFSSDTSPPSSVFLSAEMDCGAEGRFVWSYVEREFETGVFLERGFLCNGTNPRGRCSGSTVEVATFSTNTSVVIEVEFIPTNPNQNKPSTFLPLSFPPLEVQTFLNVGAQKDSISLRGNFINLNTFSSVNYLWSCVVQNVDECGRCPPGFSTTGEPIYSTSENFLTLEFNPEEFSSEECIYEFGLSVNFPTTGYTHVEEFIYEIFTWNRELPAPVVSFDPVISTCGSATGVKGGIYFSLESLEIPSGFDVVDVVWGQVEGDVLRCDDESNQNCGGDGETFIFFPIQETDEEACVPRGFEVTVSISDGSGVSSSTIPLCEAVPLLPPSGGTCVVVDDCSVPFTEIAVECSGWSVPCGEFELSFTPTKLSEGTNRLVPINARPASNSFIMPSNDFEIIIQVCNFDVCTDVPLLVEACEDEKVEVGLVEAEERLVEDQLDVALQTMLSVGDSTSECDEVKSLSKLVEQYISLSVGSVDGNVTNLPDTTTLMELLGVIGEKECEIPEDLFESLSLLCVAPTNTDVQTFALDVLLADSLNGASSVDRINLIDEAIQISECAQSVAIPERCSNAAPSLYQGDAFYYSQHIVTLPQLREGVTIEAPNATLFLPPKFDKQIAYDYRKTTGDTTIPYSCVAVNILRTDTILSTPIPIDSAVLGATFFVYVNGTSVRIPVGHNGRPAKNVVIRLRREGNFTQETKSKRFLLHAIDDRKAPQCSYYEAGELNTEGCVTLEYDDNYVNCSCTHFSNFGLLFGKSNEDWTTWRILSISFLGGVWLLLFLFILLVSFSHSFRVSFSFETEVENKSRVLGERTTSRGE